ncbi:MAG: acyl-CoA synthetase [Burkholderiales bacterium]|nr:acyl-CoA synthetase [Burkholderiales bacterium]
MAALALIRHTRRDQVFAWRRGEAIDAGRFLADARALAERLPRDGPLLNGCQDRYHFTVGLAAALLAGKQSVVPHNHLPQTLGELAQRFGGLHALIDSGPPPQHIPYRRYPDDYPGLENVTAAGAFEVPLIDEDHIAAWLFTSGSTGAALAHPRRWGQIVRSSVAEAQRLGLYGCDDVALLATVPAQHSYGFESAIGLPLLGGGVLAAERPFYPADVHAELARLPGRRALITAPVHLRALLASALPPLRIDLILSATAPLSLELAQAAEARFGAEVIEIYGSTESGQVASRRTVHGTRWQPLHGVVFAVADGITTAHGGHVGPATPLADAITLHDDGRFELHGRIGDLIHVGGKRSSIAFLEAQLCAIDGIDDAALLHREGSDGAPTRLTGFVVAPRLSQPQLLAALRRRFEAAFVPRPLYRVAQLPRDGNGKLPRQRLIELAEACAAERTRGMPAGTTADGEVTTDAGADQSADAAADPGVDANTAASDERRA